MNEQTDRRTDRQMGGQMIVWADQGILTKGEGSVLLTTLLKTLVL